MSARIDHTGRRYGRLLVLNKILKDKNRYFVWLCRCDCGSETRVTTTQLTSGKTKSCGCLRLDTIRILATTHGLSSSKTYKIWKGMITRCTNKNQDCWPNYGGRGISVCKRWLDYPNFLADMGETPDGLSLDRIDVNGNYEPSNCRWATRKEQAENKRDARNRLVVFNGVEMPLREAINCLCDISYLKQGAINE